MNQASGIKEATLESTDQVSDADDGFDELAKAVSKSKNKEGPVVNSNKEKSKNVKKRKHLKPPSKGLFRKRLRKEVEDLDVPVQSIPIMPVEVPEVIAEVIPETDAL